MTILNNMVLQEIKDLIKEEVRKEENQLKLEDAKVIVQVLLPEIDRIITNKVNEVVRKIATEVISWDLVGHGEKVHSNDSLKDESKVDIQEVNSQVQAKTKETKLRNRKEKKPDAKTS